MAGSVNKCILIGNLGRDPEIRSTQDGKKIANLSLATSETWNDRQSGERKEKTEWHRVSVFNDRTAGFIEQYVQKGAKLYVEGSLQTRKYTGQDGVEKYTTEIVVGAFKGEVTVLDRAGGGESKGNGDGGSQTRGNYSQRQAPQRQAADPDLSDEIPF